MGNYFYMQHIEAHLNILSKMSDNQKRAYVVKNAGTSIGAIFAAMGCMLAGGILIAVFLVVLYNNGVSIAG
jgi:hypothetical protein